MDKTSRTYNSLDHTKQQPRQRLDQYLASQYLDISRAYLQKLCNNDEVLVNGVAQKAGYKLKSDDIVLVLHDMKAIGKPADIDIPIVYEDKDVLVVDKPAGVLSHGLSKFHEEPSVASFLRQKARMEKNDERAGIVHRLDRVTSGLMICAKSEEAATFLQKQFADRSVKKVYYALVEGIIVPGQATIDVPLERNPNAPATWRPGKSGKFAQTEYKVIKTGPKSSLVELLPFTGRTHQLRVHLQYINHPIVGDYLYGGIPAVRLMLHAAKLDITIPSGERMKFESQLPDSFRELI